MRNSKEINQTVQLTMTEYILDIVQNSVEAGSSLITIDFLENNSNLQVCIGDNGCGMDEQTLQRVTDPFFTNGEKHVRRRIGLGIPFLKQAVELVEGDFDISSEVGTGTSLHVTFNMDHVDCPPIGDLPGLFRSVMLFDGSYDMLIYRAKNDVSYRVSRGELQEALGDLYDAQSMMLVKDYFSSQEEELY